MLCFYTAQRFCCKYKELTVSYKLWKGLMLVCWQSEFNLFLPCVFLCNYSKLCACDLSNHLILSFWECTEAHFLPKKHSSIFKNLRSTFFFGDSFWDFFMHSVHSRSIENLLAKKLELYQYKYGVRSWQYLSYVYTLLQKIQISWWPQVTDLDSGSCQVCQMVLGVICKRPVLNFDMGSFASYSQDSLTKLKWPEVGVGDIGTSEY